MKRIKLIAIALTTSTLVANGNPIAVPGQLHSITIFELTAEDVVVAVGASESRVTGKYTFRPKSVESYESFARDVSIAIPVILPANQTQREWLDSARLNAKIDNREYSDFWVTPYRPETVAVQPQLPQGWKLVFFCIGQAPPTPHRNNLNVQISYTQPHLPGNISAYLPILPDDIVKKNYLITFQAQDGIHFSPSDRYEVVGKASDTNLSVRPANLQLLKAQIAQLGQ